MSANLHAYPLLDTVETPEHLRALPLTALPQLAEELRAFLLDSVSRTGGHFASNLGTIELTIALHYVFDTPHDRLVWDVGHQTYPHKILTGRKKDMSRLRMQGGIAGFPKREESPYDTFGVGHSSTSIGAALGMASASRLQGQRRKAIAIIGDGAMTAGMAFEALNHAGDSEEDLLVILNDNDMSISPNVGALNKYLAKLLSSRFYTSMRKGSSRLLEALPPIKEFARRSEEHVKGMFTPGTLFEEFGFNYIGPIDGHDLEALVDTLHNLKALEGPQFLHVVTKKGQGYKLAEKDPVLYHGVSQFDPKKGMVSTASPHDKPTYTKIFGEWLCDMAEVEPTLVAITPAMREGSGMVSFEKRFPDRYFDVGIAEQHAVTFAAGLACEGLHPVVAIYSTFLQRAYDQLIHDVALQNLPVVFAIDRAGLVGADGPTHAGAFDLSFLRCIPNIVVIAPADENECRRLLCTAFAYQGPVAVRYPRGTGVGVTVTSTLTPLPFGKGEIRRSGGSGLAVLVFGTLLAPALKVGEALDLTIINMRFVKPLDEALLEDLVKNHHAFITLEENVIMGGAGSAITEWLNQQGHFKPVLQLGLPDHYIEHGDSQTLLSQCGLDESGLTQTIRAFSARLKKQ